MSKKTKVQKARVQKVQNYVPTKIRRDLYNQLWEIARELAAQKPLEPAEPKLNEAIERVINAFKEGKEGKA